MRVLLDRLYLGAGVLAGVCLVLTLAFVTLQMVARALGFLAPGADDFAVYALTGTAFLALPYAFRKGAHIRVGLILNKVPARRRRMVELACLAVMVLLSSFLAWSGVAFVWTSYQLHDLATTYFATPLWIPRLLMAIGLVLLFVAVLEEFVSVVRGRQPSYATGAAEEI